MKVIEPLFLDELHQEFADAAFEPRKLNKLLERLGNLKIFDPACGSGNFLIIAYKELCALEIEILQHMEMLKRASNNIKNAQHELVFSRIRLDQFYGIEIDDLAHELAILSLWLAQHQMNLKFKSIFSVSNPTLPLQAGGNITLGNACWDDWEKVCPKAAGDEIYILGNPPYLGSKRQNEDQKSDMAHVFKSIEGYKNIDYIGCWFFLASFYILNANAKVAFVSTNSLNQGDQVGLLWRHILNYGLEIHFAHTSFKWENHAKGNAAVICTIVALRNLADSPKHIYGEYKKSVSNISPYLINAPSTIITKRSSPLSIIPEMVYGNMPLEGGFLKLDLLEKDALLAQHPVCSRYVRPLVGGEEFLNDIPRFCLWIYDKDKESALMIPEIEDRIKKVNEFRVNGGDVARTLSNRSHQFRYMREAKDSFIAIPCTSSERREYMQCGFFDSKFITLNSVQIIYDSEPYIFGIISSKLHMAWVKAVAGRLKSDYRYSTAICYNTFPFPNISDKQKLELEECTFRILDAREQHSQKTLAQLYDPEKMPDDLRHAHHLNDLAVERCYRSKPFTSDEERLEYLFKLYEKMIAEESASKLKSIKD